MIALSVYDVLRRPIVTEKSDAQTSLGKFTFEVAIVATKEVVKKAVEQLYGVDVVKVNIINVKGKEKKFRGNTGKRSDRKKAIVTLKEGQSIDFAGEIK